MPAFQDRVNPARTALSMGLHTGGQERMLTPTGTFFITLTDEATGEVLQHIDDVEDGEGPNDPQRVSNRCS